MKQKSLASSTLWRLFQFLRPKMGQYVISMLIVAAIFASERMFAGFIVKWFVDSIALKDMGLLKKTVLYWVIFAICLTLATPVFLYLWRTCIVHGTANLRQAIFSHLQRLPLGYYENRHSGEAMSILTNDVAAAEQVYQDNIYNLVQSLMQGLAAVVFMMILKWDLALLIILGGLAPLIINTLYAKPLRKVGTESQEKLAGLSERLSDLLAGFQVVRTFSLGDWILKRFNLSNQQVLDVTLRRVQLDSTLAMWNNIAGIGTAIPLMAGAYMVLTGQTTLGTLFGLVQLNNPVINMVYSISGIISGIQGSLAAGDRILKVLDAALEPERYPASSIQAAQGRIPLSPVPFPLKGEGVNSYSALEPDSVVEFRQVRFSYSDGLPILQDISFDIHESQVAALVGPSGSGKSTIFRLLMGHYPVTQGAVSVFGKPIHSYSLHELRDRFAFVPQDAYLYSGTVLENIRYGKPGASEEEITAAARASYAHDFILELPEGYHTLVGERGARLSGGQRQRIAIARALLKNAPVLLLDEATSSLDSESEELVQHALQVLMRGRTTVAIAHRLSTIEHADMIYVLENGRVVEQGNHAELVGKEGLYSHLYQLQFKDAGSAPAVIAGGISPT
jgi:ATP-binding cassette subfamily B protein